MKLNKIRLFNGNTPPTSLSSVIKFLMIAYKKKNVQTAQIQQACSLLDCSRLADNLNLEQASDNV